MTCPEDGIIVTQFPVHGSTVCPQLYNLVVDMTITPLEATPCGYQVRYKAIKGGHALSNFAIRIPTGAKVGCVASETIFGCVAGAQSSGNDSSSCVGTSSAGNAFCSNVYPDNFPTGFWKFDTADNGPQCYNASIQSYEIIVNIYGVDVVCGGTWAGKAATSCANCSAPFDFVTAYNISQCVFPEEDACPCQNPEPPVNTDTGGLSAGAIGGITAGECAATVFDLLACQFVNVNLGSR